MQINFDWQMYLAAARSLGDLQLKKSICRQALCKAEELYGLDSLQAGLVLLDLSECLKAQGDEVQAVEMTERACDILRSYVRHNFPSQSLQVHVQTDKLTERTKTQARSRACEKVEKLVNEPRGVISIYHNENGN